MAISADIVTGPLLSSCRYAQKNVRTEGLQLQLDLITKNSRL